MPEYLSLITHNNEIQSIILTLYQYKQIPVYHIDMLNNYLYIFIYKLYITVVMPTATYAVKWLLMMDKEHPKHVELTE
jgi:hypothetical protein